MSEGLSHVGFEFRVALLPYVPMLMCLCGEPVFRIVLLSKKAKKHFAALNPFIHSFDRSIVRSVGDLNAVRSMRACVRAYINHHVKRH